MEIFPSIFGADLMHLQEQIDELEQNDMAYLHVDMMDGNYVPNIAFGPNQIAAIKNGCKKMKVDVPIDQILDIIMKNKDIFNK